MYHIMPWQTNKLFFILLSQHLAQCQNSVADALRARAQRCAVLYPLQILADGSTALFLKVLQQLLGNAGCAPTCAAMARAVRSLSPVTVAEDSFSTMTWSPRPFSSRSAFAFSKDIFPLLRSYSVMAQTRAGRPVAPSMRG